MTRINCCPVEWLSNKHLVAEYRELPRVFDLSLAAQLRDDKPNDYIPLSYTMGKGHVKFFYPRLRWCVARQLRLIAEMQARNYKPTFLNPFDLLVGHDTRWLGTWSPTAHNMIANLERLIERDPTHYRGIMDKFDKFYKAYMSTVATVEKIS